MTREGRELVYDKMGTISYMKPCKASDREAFKFCFGSRSFRTADVTGCYQCDQSFPSPLCKATLSVAIVASSEKQPLTNLTCFCIEHEQFLAEVYSLKALVQYTREKGRRFLCFICFAITSASQPSLHIASHRI